MLKQAIVLGKVIKILQIVQPNQLQTHAGKLDHRFTAIVNNSNIGGETTKETVLDSLAYIERLCAATGLPLWMHTAEKSVAEELVGLPIMPLTLQKKYFDLPT